MFLGFPKNGRINKFVTLRVKSLHKKWYSYVRKYITNRFVVKFTKQWKWPKLALIVVEVVPTVYFIDVIYARLMCVGTVSQPTTQLMNIRAPHATFLFPKENCVSWIWRVLVVRQLLTIQNAEHVHLLICWLKKHSNAPSAKRKGVGKTSDFAALPLTLELASVPNATSTSVLTVDLGVKTDVTWCGVVWSMQRSAESVDVPVRLDVVNATGIALTAEAQSVSIASTGFILGNAGLTEINTTTSGSKNLVEIMATGL